MCLSPLHRRARDSSTPATTASHRFGSEGSTPEVPFRPRGFSPPRRLPPLHESRACCIPLPILGSTAFPLVVSRSEDRDILRFPAMQVRTPRRTPRRQPERVTASVAPLPFPARSPPLLARSRFRFQVCRGGRIGSVGFEALLHRRVWCRPRRCRWVNDPLLPGLRSSSRSFTAARDPVSHRRTSTEVAHPGCPG